MLNRLTYPASLLTEKPPLLTIAESILAHSKASNNMSFLDAELLENSFKEIIRDHGALITRLCYNYVTPRTTLEDLYQDCLVNIWRGLRGYRRDSNLSTWIYRVVINTCITSFRSSSRQPETVKYDHTSDIREEGEEDADDNVTLLREYISRLSLLDRGIIMMWLDERSYDEIAEVTGISRNNVGTRIHRIKEKIRSSFKGDCESREK